MRSSFLVCLAAILCVAVPPATALAREVDRPIITVVGPLKLFDAGSPSAVPSSQLSAPGPARAEDLDRLTPGLTVGAGAARGVPSYTIRGAGLNDISTNAESSVGLYRDDVGLPYAIMSRGLLFDMDSVEIHKGAQGVTSGRSETGGRIVFKSAAPRADFGFGAKYGVDNWGVSDIEGFVTGPIAGARARLSGRLRYSGEGYQKSISRPGDRLGAVKEAAARGTVDWNRDKLTARLSAHWDEDRSETIAPTAYDGRAGGFASSQPRPTPFDALLYFSTGDNRAGDWDPSFLPKQENVTRGGSLRVEWNTSDDLRITSISAGEFFDRDERVEISGLPLADTRWRIRNSIRALSQEVQVQARVGALETRSGVYFSHDDVSEKALLGLQDSTFNALLGVNDLLLRSQQSTDQIAAFASGAVDLTSSLSASFGARYTRVSKDWRSCSYDSGDGSAAGAWNNILTPFVIRPSGLPDPGLATAGGCVLYNDLSGTANFGTFAPFVAHRTDEGGSWRVSLGWKTSTNSQIYLTAAQGFKSGGFNGVVTQTYSQSAPYQPERLRSYELGYATTSRDGAARLKLSAFFNDYRQKQETTYAVTPVGNIPALANIPKSEVHGIDFDAAWRLSPAFELALTAAHAESKIRSYDMIDPDRSMFPAIVRTNAAGFPLPNTPRWQARGSAAYRWQATTNLTVTIESGLSFKSDSYGSADKRNPKSDYLLIDSRLSVATPGDRAVLSLWAKNMTNEYYWTSAYIANGVYARLNGTPATFGLTLGIQH
jgi:iron complex outermembrane receptor protein